MCSSQFEFLDLSEIGDEDFQELVGILDEKKCDLCLPVVTSSGGEPQKEVEEIGAEDDASTDDNDILSQSRKDANASGISFFVDGGMAEDIELSKTPPMLSSETPPPSSETPETPPTPANEEEEEETSTTPHQEEDISNVYPSHTPQPPYMTHPPPPLMQPPMSAPSGSLYNIPPPYPPHTGPPVQNGMYQHVGAGPAHSHHLVPPTVHIENCHVNLTQPHGALYGPPSLPYQGSSHHQVFQPYMMGEQQPPMPMHMKPGLDRDYDHKRHDPHMSRGYPRGRGRGRGRRKGRDDHERSNSVSSDHSSYSDSGGKPHYKENVPPPPHMGHNPYGPLMHYPQYFHYTMNSHHMPRAQHSYPIMPHQTFIPDPYQAHQPHILTYSTHHPMSMPILPHDGPTSPPTPSHHDDPGTAIPQSQIQEHITVQQQVTSITTHASYIEASHVSPAVMGDAIHQYAYTSVASSGPDVPPVCVSSTACDPTPVTSCQQQHQPIQIEQPPQNEETYVQVEEEKPTTVITTIPDPEPVSAAPIPKEEIQVEFMDASSIVESEEMSDEASSPQFSMTHIEPTLEPYNPKDSPSVTPSPPPVEDIDINPKEETSPTPKEIFNSSSAVPEPVTPNQTEIATKGSQPPKTGTKNQPRIKESNNYEYKASSQSIDAPSSSRDPSPSVSFNNKNSPVPSSAQKSNEKDTSSTGATLKKKERKNNHAGKESSGSTSSSACSSSRSSPNMSFESKNSITIYNKSLPQPTPIKDVKASVPLPKPNKPKSKIENGTANEKQPLLTTNTPSSETAQEKKYGTLSPKEPVPMPVQPPVEVNTSTKIPVGESFLVAPPPAPVQEGAAWGQKKSWSQLFKPNDEASVKQVAFVSPFNAKEGSDNESSKVADEKEHFEVSSPNDEVEKGKVGALLKQHIQNYTPVLLQPRGLINKNYWCYVNAPLQALLACPSFYQLAKTLAKDAGSNSGNTSTPFINSVVDFASQFSPMSPPMKTSRKKDSALKKEPELVTGQPFEPTCIYKMLINCKENQFTEGRQQDAEEMLSCVLNGLHDEMVESLKLAGGSAPTQNGVSTNEKCSDQSDDENEWKVQGPRKKSCITRTAHFHPSPISHIFWGQLRSVLQQAGGNTTANLQPFNTLPLDIQSAKVDTLKDALSQLVTREEISGFTCPKTNQEVTASNQVMFEDLPRVLILQLKRFIYDKDGGLQKVTKRLQFPIDLDITKDLISLNSRGKFPPSQRKYKLFALVNHEGKEATKGHYVADVFHNGYGCWVRYDDANVKAIPEAVVLRHEPPRVPYLLFYRRNDTLLTPPASGGGNTNPASNPGSSNRFMTKE